MALVCTAVSCRPDEPDDPDEPVLEDEEALTRYYVNVFSYNMLKSYYLWVDEISKELNAWTTDEEPIQKVQKIRYKDSSGQDIDRWTQLTDDFESFSSSVAGVSTTYGCALTLYYTDSSKKYVCAVVRYTSADSPARKAGLKRGDVIMKIGGKSIPTENYLDMLYDEFLHAPSCSLTLSTGATVSMTAVRMYEDPVLLYKVFDCGAKKVGYLVYNSFTADSWDRLIEACKYFCREGISELILDLRYNGGGYVTTEYTLASMIAPRNAVTAKEIFETSVYNSNYTAAIKKAYGEDALNSRFQTEYKFSYSGKDYDYNTSDANLGISKLYAIMTGSSASASEALLTGLIPYMDVEIIGEQSYGKYCSGIIYGAEEWYNNVKDQLDNDKYTAGIKYTDNWGIYVMIGRFADKFGKTPCMPAGFTPNVAAQDKPSEFYELGDEREAMLRIALIRAGKTDIAPLIDTKSGERHIGLSPELELPDIYVPKSPGLILDREPFIFPLDN